MKRILAFVLVLALVVSLAACGDSDTESQNGANDTPLTRSESPQENTSASPSVSEEESEGGAHGIITKPAVSLEAVLSYIETGDTSIFDPANLSDSDKADLKRSVESAGGNIVYGADGSIDITGSGSTHIIIHADGSFEGTDEDGLPFNSVDVHTWPDSELARSVPKPEFELSLANEEDGVLEAMFNGVTLEKAKSYCASLKSAGFDVDPVETDMNELNMYSYSASNADGVWVEFTFMDTEYVSGCTMSIRSADAYPGYDDDYSYDDYSYEDYSYEDYSYEDYSYDYSSGDYDDTFSWPTDGAFKYLPSPDFDGITQVTGDEESYTVVLVNGTRDDIESYVAKLKSSGFTENHEYESDDDLVMYMAYNSQGYGVLAEFVSGIAVIAGTKAPVDFDDR